MTRETQRIAGERRLARSSEEDNTGRGLWRVLSGLVAGRTKVRLEREQRSTLELILRDAPAGTVVDAQCSADRRLTVTIPVTEPLRIYRMQSEPLADHWQPALEPGVQDR